MSVADATREFVTNFERPKVVVERKLNPVAYENEVAARTKLAEGVQSRNKAIASETATGNKPSVQLNQAQPTKTTVTNSDIPTPSTKPSVSTPTTLAVPQPSWVDLIKKNVLDPITPTPETIKKVEFAIKHPTLAKIFSGLFNGGPTTPRTERTDRGGEGSNNPFPTTGGSHNTPTTTKNGSTVKPLSEQSWWRDFMSTFSSQE